MKYNIKIKNLFFFGLIVIIFCFPMRKVLAQNVCGDSQPFGDCQAWCSTGYSEHPSGSGDCKENTFQTTCCVASVANDGSTTNSSTQPKYDSCIDNNGTCQAWCSDGYRELRVGSVFCKVNTFQTTCCIKDTTAPVATDSMTSCADASGRKGNCEFGDCSEGLDPVPIKSTDCWLGRNCCAPVVSSETKTPISATQINGKICKSSDGAKTGKCVDGSANGVIPECSAEEIPSTDCSKDMFVKCCGDSGGSTTYQAPSLIKCAGGQGLCYGGTECPMDAPKIADTNSDCGNGKYTACCKATAGTSCGGTGSCVDEDVICTNTISGTNCGAGKKCCSLKVPQSTVSATGDPVTVKANNAVTYESQCDSNNKNCRTDKDRAILANQCQNLFSATECVSMLTYLNSLTNKCLQMKPAGIDCSMINSGGFYGNEASKFASYYIKNASSAGTGVIGAGGLDFDSIARTGIPDSPNVKVVLVNIVKWMLEIIGIITLIAFIISGGQYLMASGDDKMIETAKKNMTYSVIGIIVALSGFVIIRAIDMALRATSSMF